MNEDEQKLVELLKEMDLPKQRVESLDLSWLGRNLQIRNRNHPKFDEAQFLLMKLCSPLKIPVFR